MVQDLLAAPGAYYLLGLRLSAEKQMKKIRSKFFVGVDNVLNTTYREYLNRQRYFADDLGRNVTVGVNIEF